MAKETTRKNDVAQGLRKSSAFASDTGTVVELARSDGAIVVVAYRADRGQRGKVRPNDIAVNLADAVRKEMRLRADWLEADLAIFITEAAAKHPLREDEFAPGVAISVNGAARVLAKKLYLLREPLPPNATDARDAEFLLTKISVSTPGQIKYIYARAFPDIPISDRAQELIQRAFHTRSVAKA